MKLLVTLLLTIALASYGQVSDSTYIAKLEKERKTRVASGTVKVFVGVFTHVVASFHLVNSLDNPKTRQSFILYNVIGTGFGIFAAFDFAKAREIKREIDTIKRLE